MKRRAWRNDEDLTGAKCSYDYIQSQSLASNLDVLQEIIKGLVELDLGSQV
jgi:hypothetical protein